jgi:hypothetical protein
LLESGLDVHGPHDPEWALVWFAIFGALAIWMAFFRDRART